jgi:hypothetical protein
MLRSQYVIFTFSCNVISFRVLCNSFTRQMCGVCILDCVASSVGVVWCYLVFSEYCVKRWVFGKGILVVLKCLSLLFQHR